MEKIPPGESFCIKKPHLDGMEKIPIEVCPVVIFQRSQQKSIIFIEHCESKMDLVPVLSAGNDSKKYDGKIWWEDCSNIVEVNGEPAQDGLKNSDLKDGDKVQVKFGTKSKKMFKGIVQFEVPQCHIDEEKLETSQVIPNKKVKVSPDIKKTKPKSPARKEKQDDKS